MKKIVLMISCWIITLLSCIPVCAQHNYRSGYIITLEQDTLHGEIDFRTDKMNAQRCVFKSGDNANPVTYLPFEIAGYRFTDDGKFYVSRMIKLDGSEVEIPVFLEYLLQGIKSLYYYESENHTLYFIQESDRLVTLDAPELEKMKEEGLIVNGRTDRYVPALQYVFRDCPELATKVKKTPFSHIGLIEITREYHNAVCKSNEECIEFENRTKGRKGVQILFTPYVGVIQYHLLGIDYTLKPELRYGISVEFVNRRWHGALSGIVDLSLSRLVMTPYNEVYKYNFTSMAISLKIGARLTYPKGKVRPFIEGGCELFKRLKEDSLNDIFPGGYLGAGLCFKLSNKERQSLVIRGQFEQVRGVQDKTGFFNAWSAVVGYTF